MCGPERSVCLGGRGTDLHSAITPKLRRTPPAGHEATHTAETLGVTFPQAPPPASPPPVLSLHVASVSSNTEVGPPGCAWDRCARGAEGPGSSGNPARTPAGCKRPHSQTTPTNGPAPTGLCSTPPAPPHRQAACPGVLADLSPSYSTWGPRLGRSQDPLGDSDATGRLGRSRCGAGAWAQRHRPPHRRGCRYQSAEHARHSEDTSAAPQPPLLPNPRCSRT